MVCLPTLSLFLLSLIMLHLSRAFRLSSMIPVGRMAASRSIRPIPPVPSPSTRCLSTTKHPEASLTLEEIKQTRLKKIESMEALGIVPFAYNYPVTHNASQLHAAHACMANGTDDDTVTVQIAGRIMIRRWFGKLGFLTIQDGSGTIQAYLDKSRMRDEFVNLKNFTDAGDIIGLRGNMKRTDKGELSVNVLSWSMLTKALQPLPDKFHGLVDVQKRYRARHLDMIVNPEVKEVFRVRAKIISGIRAVLDNTGFIEIETPILTSQPGGAEAKPFTTYHNSLAMPLTLRIATELHLKRMVVGGFDRVYEIGRIFRNEGLSTRHNPEFTSIELYQAYADYSEMMVLVETMVANLALSLKGSMVVEYQGHTIDLSPPWKRVSMVEIVQQTTGIDFKPLLEAEDQLAAAQSAREAAQSVGVDASGTVGEVLNVLFESKCEASLMQPTFITDHPVDISPLAKPHRIHKGLTERFELFITGREIANAFSELTDPMDQRRRFEAQALKKAQGNEEACDVDEDFLQALETGMPPCAGMGIGIDRLVMLLTNAAAIRDVIAFPLLRKEV